LAKEGVGGERKRKRWIWKFFFSLFIICMLIKSMACTRVGVLLHAPVSRRTKRRKKNLIEKLWGWGGGGESYRGRDWRGLNRFLRRRVLCLRGGWTSGGSGGRSVTRRHDDLRRSGRSRRRCGHHHDRLHKLPAGRRSQILPANNGYRSGFQQSHLDQIFKKHNLKCPK
jgi:hypothetical protein